MKCKCKINTSQQLSRFLELVSVWTKQWTVGKSNSKERQLFHKWPNPAVAVQYFQIKLCSCTSLHIQDRSVSVLFCRRSALHFSYSNTLLSLSADTVPVHYTTVGPLFSRYSTSSIVDSTLQGPFVQVPVPVNFSVDAVMQYTSEQLI